MTSEFLQNTALKQKKKLSMSNPGEYIILLGIGILYYFPGIKHITKSVNSDGKLIGIVLYGPFATSAYRYFFYKYHSIEKKKRLGNVNDASIFFVYNTYILDIL